MRRCCISPAQVLSAGALWESFARRCDDGKTLTTDIKLEPRVGGVGTLQSGFPLTKRTPGRFRTRVITEGVTPSLHVDYKHSKIKQYHKEDRALRTETTINNTRDFCIGKRLKNLPALREVGFAANRRLLDVQQLSHDCHVGTATFQQLQSPIAVDGQRASALRFGDDTVQALLQALLVLSILSPGFKQKELKERLAQLLGLDPSTMTQGKMTYQLRRLRLHGFIECLPRKHRYQVTPFGLRIALFYTRTYVSVLRPGLSQIVSAVPQATPVSAVISTKPRRPFNNGVATPNSLPET
jgi:hypothetical protein